jgi:23S rRNA (cytidine1920-2'-O)/16S rRNA (cytidine1409-2'-O)-methyltransferase
MGSASERLDKLLVDRGLTASRERAQALIMAAKVLVDGQHITKAGQRVPADSELCVVGEDHPFASRGGLKLQHALETFGMDVVGLVAMDVGASTGGFTDCLLQNGAGKVYAIDVGYGQLAWKLREDPRVVVLERQNIRYLTPDQIPEAVQLATIDVSFISLKLVVPAVVPFLAPAVTLRQENSVGCADAAQHPATSNRHGVPHKPRLIALIKPQFEAGRAHVGKGGVVRDETVHHTVCDSITEFCQSLGFEVHGVIPSPILGPKGNVEFLLFASYERPCGVS